MNKFYLLEKSQTEYCRKLISTFERYLNPSLSARGIDLKEYSDKLLYNGNILIFSIDNQDVGIAAFYDNDHDSCVGYLSFISVVADKQGRGVGKALLNKLEQILKNNKMTSIRLEVRSNNDYAIEFYTRNGFISEEDDNGTSFHMEKRL